MKLNWNFIEFEFLESLPFQFKILPITMGILHKAALTFGSGVPFLDWMQSRRRNIPLDIETHIQFQFHWIYASNSLRASKQGNACYWTHWISHPSVIWNWRRMDGQDGRAEQHCCKWDSWEFSVLSRCPLSSICLFNHIYYGGDTERAIAARWLGNGNIVL